jgi:CRISPR-associated endonuclease/helicase Cas3
MAAEPAWPPAWPPTRLADLRAKSGPINRPGAILTQHLLDARNAVQAASLRIGRLPRLAISADRFWILAAWAALLHDAGKSALGFQFQLNHHRRGAKHTSARWGERHEVLSLAFVDLVLTGLPADERAWVALGVLVHHLPLAAPPGATRSRGPLIGRYPDDPERFEDAFGGQVPGTIADELLGWLAANGPESVTPDRIGGHSLPARARHMFATVVRRWACPADLDERAVWTGLLMQGAVTMADHVASGGGELSADLPLPAGYLTRLSQPYPHQVQAAAHRGHLVLLAPTGNGKTEALLGWASANLGELPGQPRVLYVLPYLASINAMTRRLAADLDCEVDQIGLAHSKAAQTLLGWAIQAEDDIDPAQAARKAHARQHLTRLFRERLRVGTPYPLLRGAILGAKNSSVLLDTANSLVLLDELHAYDAHRFGWLLAMLSCWERLGCRIAIASATLATPAVDLIRHALHAPVEIVRADPHLTARLTRHRLHVTADDLIGPASLARIHQQLAAGQSVLVVANTVARAQQLHAALAPAARRRWPDDHAAAVLLHSRFRQRDRHRIETILERRYATDAAPRSGGLVVSTQATEVSLNVDFDTGMFDPAPIEPLLQRLGRVNRLARRPPADVWIHGLPADASRARVGPYPTSAVIHTLNILSGHDDSVVAEANIQAWLDAVYATPWGDAWLGEVRSARAHFQQGFLVLDAPFEDRSELEDRFDQEFGGVEALLANDLELYRSIIGSPQLDPLLAADLLIPLQPKHARRQGHYDHSIGTWIVDAPYDEYLGLQLNNSSTAETTP